MALRAFTSVRWVEVAIEQCERAVELDPDDLDAWRAAINDNTKLLFAETIGNPGLEVLNITPDARGSIPVNEQFQTPQPHVYAVGDLVAEAVAKG